MPRKPKSDYYTPEEIKQMKEQWLKDKARIDADPAFDYMYDKHLEYQRHLNNKNLQMLFRHASRLFRSSRHDNDIFLFAGEEEKIQTIFKEIIRNGYYTNSKIEEKTARARLGKISSRQSFIRYRKGKYKYQK